MAITKVALSLDADLVRRSKRLAKQKHTFVSGLLGHYIETMTPRGKRGIPIGPLTRQSTGLVRAPHNKSYRELIEEALAETWAREFVKGNESYAVCRSLFIVPCGS